MSGAFVSLVNAFHSVQVMHVLGFDPHAFAHFRDERKRRRSQVNTSTLQNCSSLNNIVNDSVIILPYDRLTLLSIHYVRFFRGLF